MEKRIRVELREHPTATQGLRWEKVKRVAEDREPGKDREPVKVHTQDPPGLSGKLEQKRRKAGRETPKL